MPSVHRNARISRCWRSRPPEASGIALTIRSTYSRTMASSLLSNMAWSNCMISLDMAPRLFPIAVFHCLATENRPRHGPCPFPSRPESENAQEFGRYLFIAFLCCIVRKVWMSLDPKDMRVDAADSWKTWMLGS